MFKQDDIIATLDGKNLLKVIAVHNSVAKTITTNMWCSNDVCAKTGKIYFNYEHAQELSKKRYFRKADKNEIELFNLKEKIFNLYQNIDINHDLDNLPVEKLKKIQAIFEMYECELHKE